MRDNTVDIFTEWFRAQGWRVDNCVLYGQDGGMVDLGSLANFLEIAEKKGERFTEPETEA